LVVGVVGDDLFGLGLEVAWFGEEADTIRTCHRLASRGFLLNLGYFTWLEHQGVPVEEFEARRDPLFWTAVRAGAELSDEPIDEFNARTGVLETL